MENKYASIEQYLRKLSGQEKEVHVVDHNYVKPWNAHPDSHRTRPAKHLFTKGSQRYSNDLYNSEVDELDVVSIDSPVLSPFDCPKAKNLVHECERSLLSVLRSIEENQDEIDEKLGNFAPKQKRLYQDTLKLVNSYRLVELSCAGRCNGVIERSLAKDRLANQLRSLCSDYSWDKDLLNWLDETILNESDHFTLLAYLSILQTLRPKVPKLFEKTFTSSVEALNQISKRQYDPVHSILNQYKPRKLPGSPVIVICPSDPNQQIGRTEAQRIHIWSNSLSCLCKVLTVPLCSRDEKKPTTVEECLKLLLTSIRTKVYEVKKHYPNRPIVLLGWTTGALMACHVALQETVAAVICLGFPLTGVNGSRGDLNDPLLDSKVPTLFVIGKNAHMCTADDAEDFRSRMRADTDLVVIEGANDFLVMNEIIKKHYQVTQEMVDRCILEEISDFLLLVLNKMPSVPSANTLANEKSLSFIRNGDAELLYADESGKRKRRRPKEYSPELSPVRKKRQLGQPPHPMRNARLSPTTSESSSSSSFRNEKLLVKKLGQEIAKMQKKKLMEIKKSTNKKVGRPASGTWRKRLSTKITNDVNKDEISLKKPPRTVIDNVNPVNPIKPPKSDAKNVPFPVKILPKKNDPVDVEKAFGRDSSFLPRPLTPPEPEDTVSAEETEKAMAELESLSNIPSDSIIVSDFNSAASLLNQVNSKERTFTPVSNSVSNTCVLTSAANSHPVTKSVNLTGDTKTVPVSFASGFRSMFQSGKVISASSLQNVKYINGVSLIGSNVNHVIGSNHLNSTNPSKTTVITLSSPTTATLLVSNPNVRTQPGKIIQLLSKGNFSLATKNHVTTVNDSANSSESTDQQACNLSLLSDVAGMTEPLKDASKKIEGCTSATLVKLAVSDRTQAQPIKCLKVKRMLRAPSPPVRIETPEELVEKQLAIQALNNSIGIESPSSTVKESGYSICYAKADGSIISHSVTRPGFSYLSRPPIVSAQNRAKNKSRLYFPAKSFLLTEN